jgi:hypothetical protein
VKGVLQFTGPVRATDPVEKWKDAVAQSCDNAIMAAQSLLQAGERIAGIPSLTVYIAADTGFTQHSKLADFASEVLHERFGEAGIGSRAAIGVATLPGNAPVEIQLTAAVSR